MIELSSTSNKTAAANKQGLLRSLYTIPPKLVLPTYLNCEPEVSKPSRRVSGAVRRNIVLDLNNVCCDAIRGQPLKVMAREAERTVTRYSTIISRLKN